MKLFELLRSDDPKYKGHLWIFLVAYFFVLFNYPLVRAASTTIFFEAYGAKSSPIAWLYTVVVMTFSILVFNKFQAKHTVQKVFFGASFVSTIIFGIASFGASAGIKSLSYVSFIWKEICIVMQVNLMLAYANNFFRKEDFKKIVGPVGAVGSAGGLLGGVLTTYISKGWGTHYVSWISLIFVLLPAILFLFTPKLATEAHNDKQSPMSTLDTADIKKYIFHIALIVMLSQFVINIADFKFNLLFEKSIFISSERTAYLGTIYSWTNLLSLVFQCIFLPLLLPRISERSLHLYIPVSYLVLTLITMVSTGGNILPLTAGLYIYLKASDYSLFSGGKELLYQPLRPEQKYGAKYLTDMLVYRTSKALIAAVLIYLQSSFILNVMMVGLLCTWAVLVIKIFGIHRRLFN
jgi:AAA family ATP:ADP antiporter